MLRPRYRILLSTEQRNALNDLVASASEEDRVRGKKAEALLLAAEEVTISEIATRLEIGETTVKRIKRSFVTTGGIEFLFPAKGVQESDKKKATTKRKRTAMTEQELEIPGCDDSSRAVYRVILTSSDREFLNGILTRGKHSNRRIARAKILLNADQGLHGPAMKNSEIANLAQTSERTVQRVRKLFVGSDGVEAVVNFKHHNAGRKRKLDGKGEAQLIQLACSSPPKGRASWTLRLLAEKLVELEVVDEISHVSVGAVLKKTNLNLGKSESG